MLLTVLDLPDTPLSYPPCDHDDCHSLRMAWMCNSRTWTEYPPYRPLDPANIIKHEIERRVLRWLDHRATYQKCLIRGGDVFILTGSPTSWRVTASLHVRALLEWQAPLGWMVEVVNRGTWFVRTGIAA